MTVGSWEVALFAAKWLVLLATAGAIGGAYALALARKLRFTDEQPLWQYLRNCGIIGLFANLLWFLLQIGAVNRSGLAGMVDMNMGAVLVQSGPGAVLQLRIAGFAVLTVLTLPPVCAKLPHWLERCLYVVVAMVLVSAVGASGHVSTLPPLARVALSLHVLAVFLWIGALYPLLVLSRAHDLLQVHELMRKFGRQAMGIVAVLVLSGVFLALQLLEAPADLLTTPYGRVLLLKLLGVYAVLMFAAINKWLLVPRLLTGDSSALKAPWPAGGTPAQEAPRLAGGTPAQKAPPLAGGASALESSIRMEWIVALLVLAVTSWLTTNTGPAGL